MGRPSDFTDGLADAICERIADGESLRSICLSDDMPSKATVFRWLSLNISFQDQYARARDTQADVLFDEVIYIADNTVTGITTKTDKDGNTETTEGDMLNHRRLQIDARKWMAGKLRPKKYGELRDKPEGSAAGSPGATVNELIIRVEGGFPKVG